MLPPRPLPIPLPLAIPLSWAYFAAMRLHIALRAATRTRLPIPVISIGNLSVGGTGKTPMVLHLAGTLAHAGHHPCIAMRGYSPRNTRTNTATSPNPAAADPATTDEADAYRRAFDRLHLRVPIVAQPNRAEGVRRLLTHTPDLDCVLLDDGFQHHRLARVLDLVLIDATRPPGADRLLPAGWLREPPTALRRAHAVIITHAEGVTPHALADLSAWITRTHGRPPIAVTRHTWQSLDLSPPSPRGSAPEEGRRDRRPPLSTSPTDHTAPVTWLRAKRILVLSAIGNPAPFLAAATDAIGAPPAVVITLRDHDSYAPPTVERILAAAQGMDAILTTDKDWSKLRHIDPARWPCHVARPRLELQFDHGREALHDLTLRAVARTDESATAVVTAPRPSPACGGGVRRGPASLTEGGPERGT